MCLANVYKIAFYINYYKLQISLEKLILTRQL